MGRSHWRGASRLTRPHGPVDLRAEDTLAVRISMALAEKIRPEDLERPTPCAAWDVSALLAHEVIAAFAPRLPAPSDADPLARIVTVLGRSPSWPDSGR